MNSLKLPAIFKDGVEEYLYLSLFPKKDADGQDKCKVKFKELVRVLSLSPAYTTVRVNSTRSRRQDVLQELQKLLCQDENLVEFVIEPHPVLPDLLVIPSPSLKNPQLVIPISSEKKVIVDSSCATAVLRGAHIFAPGVMGCMAGILAGDDVSVFVDLDGKCNRGLKVNYTGQTAFIANGIMQHSRKVLMEEHDTLRGVAVKITETYIRNPCLNGLMVDTIFPQNLPSVVCGHVLDPQPGDVILDMCAAPGGKTTHIASLMKDEGVLIALDKAKSKVSIIKKHAKNLGLTCIHVFAADSSSIVAENATEIPKDYKPPYPCESFDRIMLDAPCSATGQRAQISHRQSLADMKSHPSYQKKLFREAVHLLKTGGVLIYSTCALPVDENEAVVAWALKEFPHLKLQKQDPHLGGSGILCHGLQDDQISKLQRFWPKSAFAHSSTFQDVDCDNDTIGFFIAKFTKYSRNEFL